MMVDGHYGQQVSVDHSSWDMTTVDQCQAVPMSEKNHQLISSSVHLDSKNCTAAATDNKYFIKCYCTVFM